jgi:lactoylglutathione lyase
MDHRIPDSASVKQAVPFFGVADIQASLRFYVDGLGFTMTNQWTPGGELRWCWLELGGAALMLQQYTKEGHGGRRPEGELGLGVSVCFMCEDAITVYREATARGLAVERPFVGNGLWVAGLKDPDGYRLYFESPTDEPEETLLP